MSGQLDEWEKFCKTFDEAVFNCAESGTAAKLTITFDDAKRVTVEVYREKGDMKKLETLLKNALADPKIKVTTGGATQ